MKPKTDQLWHHGHHWKTAKFQDAAGGGLESNHIVVWGGTQRQRLALVDALHLTGPFRNRQPVTLAELCQEDATSGRRATLDGTQARDVLILDRADLSFDAIRLLEELLGWCATWEARPTAHLPVPPRILAIGPLPERLTSALGSRWTHLVVNEGVVVPTRPGQSAG